MRRGRVFLVIDIYTYMRRRIKGECARRVKLMRRVKRCSAIVFFKFIVCACMGVIALAA